MSKGKNRLAAGILILIWALSVSGCSSLETDKEKTDSVDTQILMEKTENRDKNISPQLTYQSSMELEYAEKFAVDYYEDGYVLLTIADGRRFLIIPENCEAPEELAPNIVVLKRPLAHLYLAATAAMDMFCALDALDCIRFSGQKTEGWYIEEARAAMEEGKIVYAGKYNMPDYELILSENCSLAIENTMIFHSPEVVEKLEEFQIPVLVDYSSYEPHPLGRVEWVKVYGVLTDREEEAMAAFRVQADRLDRVQREEETGKTVAFFYITTNGAVNVRKSSDYVPKMIELAGGRYIFENLGTENDNKSSMNMQMEEFYKEAKDADFLIYNSTIGGEIATVEELLQKSEMLKDFKAVKEGNVWCTTSDLYQHSMSLGEFIEDIYHMLSEDAGSRTQMQYIYLLE